jgi:flavin reductase (DIM6/NTAB) family NADH-FMN oxidoreductase RutF
MAKYIDLIPRDVSRIVGGGQVVNVSTISKDGVPDVMSAAWNTAFDSDKLLVVLDLGHTTTKNIIETGRFVVGVPSAEQVKEVFKVGSAHGRDTGDKFKWAGIEAETSRTLKIPVIPGEMAYIECELMEPEVFKKTGVAIGKAVGVYAREDLWDNATSSFGEGFKHVMHYINESSYYADGKITKI